MKNLVNCPNCGTLFVKALRPLCNNCHKEREESYNQVYQYMRKKENRMAGLQEVHEFTGVPIKLIQEFIREGRLHTSSFPNLGYPCQSCGALIQQGKICQSCKDNIETGLKQEVREKQFDERKSGQAKLSRESLRDRLN
ncbi:TIGR03826 family flagellar region protein [Halalkalibacterium ligniniphilum]|uniref:TIGR03826 family flagellar region protein n=1 Tax=Halalkalibacterium ligniniphilum TaxID=1134413 RepID=UPI00034A18C6|nr:TIGR03826 family flagellar region protein [Halalkalibacterium ligniniphilum]